MFMAALNRLYACKGTILNAHFRQWNNFGRTVIFPHIGADRKAPSYLLPDASAYEKTCNFRLQVFHLPTSVVWRCVGDSNP